MDTLEMLTRLLAPVHRPLLNVSTHDLVLQARAGDKDAKAELDQRNPYWRIEKDES